MNSLFLAHKHSLSPGGGGQQQCTREYRETLVAAGFDLLDVSFETDRSWKTRVKSKFFPKPYGRLIPEEFFSRVDRIVRTQRPAYIFCNLADFISFGSRLRAEIPRGVKLVLLSHGLASVDEIHATRIARLYPDYLPKISDKTVGETLRIEGEGLPEFDHVFCLTAFEVEICRWLGARSVSWLPRVLVNNFLSWNPIGNRVGCVGTFDHPPNLEGIESFCAALQSIGPGSLRLRLVTRSEKVVARLRSRYQFVDDLGALEVPGGLEGELATWNAFVHPIFCYARGCSTKVATALSCGLPIVTSSAGLRGYTWKEGYIPVSNTPSSLAESALATLDLVHASALREKVKKAVFSAPELSDIAAQIRRDLQIP